MNQELLDRILKSPRLPSLPTIAIEVIDLVQRQDVNIKQIAETIQHDPALSTKILKTVNSSFYGQAHAISTISHALVVLGLNSVKTLALGFTLVTNLVDENDEDGFNHLRFWKRSLYSAVAARSFAKQINLVQQEEAFLGGLLCDLGMLAMGQTLGKEYHMLIAQAAAHRDLHAIEQEYIDTDHAQVGQALAESWRLPPLLVAPIAHHENPENTEDELLPMVRCVALGCAAAELFMADEQPGESLQIYLDRAEQWLGIAPEDAEPLLKKIHKGTIEMKRLFDLPTDELGNADEILNRANEALENITLMAQRKQSELAETNERLVQEANTDSLTGAANRRRFNEFIAELFQSVAAGGPEPMSILFFDADHFKQFNDTYGHQTGDRVLVELAATLRAHMPEHALVARYGGEEFAVVLPKTDRVTAARLAEGVRQGIEQMKVTSDEGEPLTVTSSIGVATFDGTVFERVEQFVKAADQAVYAAKSGGRNCVRVFTPRKAAPKQVA